MGALKIRQRLLVDSLDGGGALVNPGPRRLIPEAGISIEPAIVGHRRERISLSGVEIEVAAAADFGGTKLCEFEATPGLLVGARLVGAIEVSAGLDATLAAGNVDLGAGTVVASNTTLATTMINIVPKIDIPASGAVSGGAVPSLASSGVDVFVNASAACAVDSVITFLPGSFVDLLFVDIGGD